jgi:hypothetical protein
MKVDIVHHLPDAIPIIVAIGLVWLVVQGVRLITIYVMRVEIAKLRRHIRHSEYSDRWGG